MPDVIAGGMTIHYEEAGAGDPVVLVNGTGESGATWARQTRALAERWRVVVIDNRDVGRSSYATDDYTPADMAADVAAVIDALACGPAHIVGYSLGGAAAQELAIARPDCVRSLVLLSTWDTTDGFFAGQMRSWQALAERFSTPDRQRWTDERAFLDALFPWIFSPASYESPGVIDRYLDLAEAEEPGQRPEGWIRQCSADIAHDAAARLGAITAPALVVVGEDDICTPPRYSKALCAGLGDAALEMIPRTGHGAVFEAPDTVTAAIESFLSRR